MKSRLYFATTALLLSLPGSLLASELELSFKNPLLDLSLDYRLQGDFTDNDLAQTIDSSLRSQEINDLLRVDAVLEADSVVKILGESYHHRLTSAFTRPVTQYADINLEYQYILDKPSAFAMEQQITGYALGLDGSLIDGRLSFHSDYGQTVYDTSHTVKLLNFNSRYRIWSDMHIDLSGAVRQQYPWNDAGTAQEERRYGVGLHWSPSRDYAFSVELDGLEDTREQHSVSHGSGRITWTPQSYWQLELSYDTQLAGDMQSLMLHARLDLGSG
ncbi:hypothetical protein [Kineobactrum salinum]|uniref:Uncharacterized protein n=1 Tax=Kineobactrum salinum TaxID=2708301 RepID=A0A6C0TX00_9GAMM|nr:hypothetical protein [Kineobactrum salinum]QIB64352.1 hypothetical protein G3T16_01955 [Kineobactrum salinum]